MEGSPVDGLIFFILIFAAFVALTRRRLNWLAVISENWPIFLFYAFLLVSVLWANSPFVSFKRWFKEFGNIAVLLVILTDPRPQQALRAVFVRCACLLLPLSLVFIRYFPSLGRFYSGHGGEGEMTGVTTQKNSLGVLLLVCGLVLFWDWLELRKEQRPSKAMRLETKIHFGLLLLALYLLHLSDSKTSMVCLLFGAVIIIATRLPFFRKQPHLLGMGALAVVLTFWVLDETVGIKENVVAGLGRDMTYTGRTEVWRELLGLHTDPLLGVGFMSFWDDKQSAIPTSRLGRALRPQRLSGRVSRGRLGWDFLPRCHALGRGLADKQGSKVGRRLWCLPVSYLFRLSHRQFLGIQHCLYDSDRLFVPARCHRPCLARLRDCDASRRLFRNRVAAIGDGTGKDFRSHLRFLDAKQNSSANYSDGQESTICRLLARAAQRQASDV